MNTFLDSLDSLKSLKSTIQLPTDVTDIISGFGSSIQFTGQIVIPVPVQLHQFAAISNKNNHIYTCAQCGSSVEVFDLTGQLLFCIGENCDNSGNLMSEHIINSSRNVYIYRQNTLFSSIENMWILDDELIILDGYISVIPGLIPVLKILTLDGIFIRSFVLWFEENICEPFDIQLTHDGHYFIGVVCASADYTYFYATYTKNGIFLKQFKFGIDPPIDYDSGSNGSGSDDSGSDDSGSDVNRINHSQDKFFDCMPVLDKFDNVLIRSYLSSNVINVCNLDSLGHDIAQGYYKEDRRDLKIKTLISPTTGDFIEIYRKTTGWIESLEIKIHPIHSVHGINDCQKQTKSLQSKPQTFVIPNCNEFVGITTTGQFVLSMTSSSWASSSSNEVAIFE